MEPVCVHKDLFFPSSKDRWAELQQSGVRYGQHCSKVGCSACSMNLYSSSPTEHKKTKGKLVTLQ